MSIHTAALKRACVDLNFPFKNIGSTGVFLSVYIQGKNHYFIANQIPINSSIVATIAEDKGHAQDLLSPVIRMPKTLSFVDPHARELFQPFVKEKTLAEIAQACEKTFSYPFIVKKNSGSQGMHVFKCDNTRETINALGEIFNQKLLEYDHIALAQEYVHITKEYRVTVLDKKIELIYLKDTSRATFTGNLSPLHWESARSVLIADPIFKNKVAEFIHPIYSVLDLNYGGLDIAIDKNDQLWLFEINSRPAYDHLVRDTGETVLVDLYQKILISLSKK